jgi:hypothetical protein
MIKILKNVLPALLILLVIFAWMAPIGPMPGFFIGGNAASVPDSWSDTSAIHEIQLEVIGTLPRVVIVWVIQVDGLLHVVGAKGSVWVSLLGQGAPIRMRMGDNTYSMHASLLTSDWEPVLLAYQDKYRADYPDIVNGFPSIEEAAETVAVYRLLKPEQSGLE